MGPRQASSVWELGSSVGNPAAYAAWFDGVRLVNRLPDAQDRSCPEWRSSRAARVRRCRARFKSGRLSQLRLEPIVGPHEGVMALKVSNRVECLEGQDRAGAIRTDLTL